MERELTPSAAPVADRAPGDPVDDALCELLPDAFVRTDASGVVRRANDAAAALLGRAAPRLLGAPLLGYVHPDHRHAVRSLVARLGELHGPQHWPLQLQTAAAAPLAVRATVTPVRDARGAVAGARWLLRPLDADAGHAGVASAAAPAAPAPDHDTASLADFLTRATAHLGASLDHDAMLRDLAHDAVPALGDWCFVDLVVGDGTLRRLVVACAIVEDAALVAPLVAAAPPLGVDSPTARAVRTHETQLADAVVPALLAGLSHDAAQRAALERMGSRAWLAVPLVARGQVLGALTFAMAASGRGYTAPIVGAAEELARRAALSADNARLYRQAVRASEAKSAFLGTMSHELRTPLTAIMGYAELLQDGIAGQLEERQLDFVRRIRESSDHLLRLVEEVLGYARLQAREERVEHARFDLGTLAGQSLALVAPQARQKGLALHVERPDEPLWIDGDATKVRQILVNLLGNAVKFTDAGEVRLRVARAPGEGARAGEGGVVLEVTDTGIGIPADLLAHVFDPFWQVEQTVTRARGGAGLGLSVVRQLAELLGGEVTVESEPRRGSRFRVWLPERGAGA